MKPRDVAFLGVEGRLAPSRRAKGPFVLELIATHPVLLAGAIFLARVLDVSLGTLRTIVVFRGHRYIAAALGFLEVVVWLVAAAQVIQNLDQWYLALAYAAGYAVGNIVGSWLEEKLAIGHELVRIMSADPDVNMVRKLRSLGYEVIDLEGVENEKVPVEVLLIVERRRNVPQLLRTVSQLDPNAVFTTNDIRRPAQARPLKPRQAFPSLPDVRKITKRK